MIETKHIIFRHTKSAKGADNKSIDQADPAYLDEATELGRKLHASQGFLEDIGSLAIQCTGRFRTLQGVEAFAQPYAADPAIAVSDAQSDPRLRDVKDKDDPTCNIIYGPGVKAVSYADLMKNIAARVLEVGRFNESVFDGFRVQDQEVYCVSANIIAQARVVSAYLLDQLAAANARSQRSCSLSTLRSRPLGKYRQHGSG